MKTTVRIIGGGLAGCEAAFQLLKRGFAVEMHEMRPEKTTGAHSGGGLAELVCSNSLKSEGDETASGALKKELKALGCRLLDIAERVRVPSGSALAVDREAFSEEVQKELFAEEGFTLVRDEVTSLPEGPAIVATGPLTSQPLADDIAKRTGSNRLYFYDAVAPIIEFDSIDMNLAYFGGRYGKGGDDYLNLPMNKEEYETFYEALVSAQTVVLKDFERRELFEGCMPVEELARRGKDTMRFGPLRPVGLRNPETGERAYAVVQMRRENAAGNCYNLVGFQTNLTFKEQKRVFSLIPALKNAEFLRYGVMHRNTYLQSPDVLGAGFSFKDGKLLYAAGQLCGVEGYVESIMSGLIAAVSLARELEGKEVAIPPETTVTGALCRYVLTPSENFQPMNANFGILPFAESVGKKDRKKYYHDRAVRDIIQFASDTGYLS